MWAATAEASSKAPTLGEIRRGSYGHAGWDAHGQHRERRDSTSGADKPGLFRRSTQNSAQGSTLDRAPTHEATIDEGGPTAEDDGFPIQVFGREELSGQSYDPTAKRGSGLNGAPSGSGKLRADPVRPSTEEVAPESDDDFDDLDDLDPRPKRRSKNVMAMLGDTSGPTATRGSPRTSSPGDPANDKSVIHPNADGYYPNGYHFPGKKTWVQSTLIGMRGLWKFTLTPLGFLIVIYGLNVVAWGGMLFLLLCNASPAMCYPPTRPGVFDCNDIDAPRRVWIEIDSQILNALFCVTGFGLIYWRFRDFYYLCRFRLAHDKLALRRLAGFHAGWFRLPGSDAVAPDWNPRDEATVDASEANNDALPLPVTRTPEPPLTGVRAPPTPLWKLDYVIWAFVINTALQAVLSGFMWGYNRYARPSWEHRSVRGSRLHRRRSGRLHAVQRGQARQAGRGHLRRGRSRVGGRRVGCRRGK